MYFLRVIFFALVLLQLTGCYVVPRFSEPQIIEEPKPLVQAPKELPAPTPQRKISIEVNINGSTIQPIVKVDDGPEIIYAPSCVAAEKTTVKPKKKKKKIVKPKPKKPVC